MPFGCLLFLSLTGCFSLLVDQPSFGLEARVIFLEHLSVSKDVPGFWPFVNGPEPCWIRYGSIGSHHELEKLDLP